MLQEKKRKDSDEEGENERELQEYSTCIPLLHCSEPLTVRPVTVFHSHEVFTLHCSTSECHSITGSHGGSVNTVYSYIQYPVLLQSVLLPVIECAQLTASHRARHK